MESEGSESTERIEIISVGVTTVDGDRASHTFALPTIDLVERLASVEFIARLLWSALSRSDEVVTFYEPFVMYRSEHVSKIEVAAVDIIEELEKLQMESL